MQNRLVVVSFGDGYDFEFKVSAADLAGISADKARDWLAREFAESGCEVAAPIGKVLLADLVLGVARSSGQRRFKAEPAWATQFAHNAAAVMPHDLIKVDVANSIVGY